MRAARLLYCCFLAGAFLHGAVTAAGQSEDAIFDDKMLLEGYADKYRSEPREILLAMIRDETLSPYKMAAAVRVFKENHSREIFNKDKREAERVLWQRLNRTDSVFVEVEIMHALCVMDRYKYFKHLVPDLINTLDHYNRTVNEMAYASILEIIESGHNRPREARIVFNTVRRILLLERRELKDIKEVDKRLQQKLDLIRWSVKILGTSELKHLPSEVLNLL